MPFHVLINNNVEVSFMSPQVFLTLKIPVSSLSPMPPVRGFSDDVMEIHRSVGLSVALWATNDFQTFLVNLFIVDSMMRTSSNITIA
jgi:hypothetical protein